MSDPYVGEIRMFGGNFAPLGWMFCNGQLLSLSEYEALFNLIGTTYGGDGVQTFALPDLRGRLPIHQSTAHPLGQALGTESVTLTTQNLPAHNHMVLGSTAEVETANPTGQVFATSADTSFYGPENPGKGVTLNGATVSVAGSGQPHDNMQPYLCVSFIIAVEGIFPQQG
ncbi:MAG: tail fiber protein [Byssovorax sp.]